MKRNTVIISVLLMLLISYGIFVYYKCTPDEENFHNIEEGIYDYNPNKKIRLITNLESIGTKTDAEIYKKILKNSYICYYKSDKNVPNEEKSKYININIFFEGVLLDLPAKQNWLVVNQEFLHEPLNNLHKIDKFICKSRYAYKLLNNLKNKYKLKGKVIYLGHTSNDTKNVNFNKRMNLYVHAAGKSHMKNTDKLINVWKKIYKKYPNNYLVVTCRGLCKNSLNSELSCSDNVICNKCSIDELLDKHSNVSDGIIYKKFIDKNDYKLYTKYAVCYICPSQVEGFGHYLNEGRLNGCAVITTDGPPMNELIIDDKNGYIIPTSKKEHSRYVTNIYKKYIPFTDFFEKIFSKKIYCEDSETFDISEDDLFNTIEKFILCSKSKKMEMCKNSRKMYLNDKTSFINKLLFLINNT